MLVDIEHPSVAPIRLRPRADVDIPTNTPVGVPEFVSTVAGLRNLEAASPFIRDLVLSIRDDVESSDMEREAWATQVAGQILAGDYVNTVEGDDE